MQHPKIALYTQIRDKIKELAPAWIDLQKGQFLNQKENYPIPLPAVLIKLGRIRWEEFSKKNQRGELTITISQYLASATDTFADSESESTSLQILQSSDDVYEKINGLSGDFFSPLERLTDSDIDYGNGFILIETEYKVSIFQDYPN